LGKMGGWGVSGGEIALVDRYSCCWGGSLRGAYAPGGLRVAGGPVEPVELGAVATSWGVRRSCRLHRTQSVVWLK
jgi:hypothetical protein